MKLLKQDEGVRFKINDAELEPYCLPLKKHSDGVVIDARSVLSSQEGLAIKTYQNDLFNNWVNTEWIDGDNGINAVTSVNVVDNKFTIDEFNMKKKVYEMLNAIGMSGGTYDDWMEVNYDGVSRQRSITAFNNCRIMTIS